MPVDTQQNHCGGEEGIMLKRGYSLKYRRIYKIWQGIRQRCNNPNDKDYEDVVAEHMYVLQNQQ